VGGHCIPLDPQYLAWRAKEANFTTRFIDIAEQVNSKMPAYNVTRISELLNTRGFPILGTEVLGVGIAYKPNIADDRESAALEVLKELTERGARVSVLDPVVGSERIRSYGYEPVDESEDLSRFEIAVILTDHSDIDYSKLAREIGIVFDTRGVYRRLGVEASNVESL
jgi:UDP-N-acetyl-D-glucosamine dehydrogenase